MYAMPYPLRPGEADCRDYLRTGRCKYGDSCKYHHPPNVESGGGVKPVDPSEPLYPLRPTEPACQYFLKHGTCKFGQSCKFHHPTGSAFGEGADRCLVAGRLVYATNAAPGSSPGDSSSRVNVMATSTSVQVLPQRPTEPNCIYFLRNGKCKYGATCKFHHPLDAIHRNHQGPHLQPTPTRRESAHAPGALSDGRPQVPHGTTYATAANVAYAQAQRLHSITERVRPPQPTHVLLPDGQIAVILDPQSLQNVNELNARDRPKFYLSKTDGSIGTLASIDQRHKADLSPILTATTNSTSNMTVDSSIDLMGTNVSYPRPAPGTTTSRSPPKSSSGGSLSAYGSLESCSHLPGDFMGTHVTYQGHAQVAPSRVPPNAGSGGSLSAWSLDSFSPADAVPPASGHVYPQHGATHVGPTSAPQYGAWPVNEGTEHFNQAQERRLSHGTTDSFDRLCHTTTDWLSNDYDIQAERHRPGQAHASPATCVGDTRRPHPVTSDEDQGLSMMTSALLTMMDHNPSARESTLATAPRSINRYDAGYDSPMKPNFHEKASYVKPPPGMSQSPGAANTGSLYSADVHQDSVHPRSPLGGGYFVGGYDMSSAK